MITAEIKLHEEPVSYAYTGYQGSSTYKNRPETHEERQKDIDEELLKFLEKDLRLGDQIKTKGGLLVEVKSFILEDVPEKQVMWYQGFPCVVKAMQPIPTSQYVTHYTFNEFDWSSHNKLADRNDLTNSIFLLQTLPGAQDAQC